MNINYHPYDKTITIPVEVIDDTPYTTFDEALDNLTTTKETLILDCYKTPQGVFANISLTSIQYSIVAVDSEVFLSPEYILHHDNFLKETFTLTKSNATLYTGTFDVNDEIILFTIEAKEVNKLRDHFQKVKTISDAYERKHNNLVNKVCTFLKSVYSLPTTLIKLF